MEYILFYFIVFFVLFLIIYFIWYLPSKRKDKLKKNKGLNFIVKKYDLKMDDNKWKYLGRLFVLVNSLILAVPIEIVFIFDINYILALVISLGIFIVLIYTFYNILGLLLKKKGW